MDAAKADMVVAQAHDCLEVGASAAQVLTQNFGTGHNLHSDGRATCRSDEPLSNNQLMPVGTYSCVENMIASYIQTPVCAGQISVTVEEQDLISHPGNMSHPHGSDNKPGAHCVQLCSWIETSHSAWLQHSHRPCIQQQVCSGFQRLLMFEDA